MKTNSHPIVICKKYYDIVFTKDEEKHHEVKTTQYFLPSFNFKAILKALKLLLLILLFIAILANKINEVAPIMTMILEQLH